MTDEQLIAAVARVWVDGGGDAEGLDWCHQKLKEAVNAEIENRSQNDEESWEADFGAGELQDMEGCQSGNGLVC